MNSSSSSSSSSSENVMSAARCLNSSTLESVDIYVGSRTAAAAAAAPKPQQQWECRAAMMIAEHVAGSVVC
jgi:hypothetical protein